MVLVAINTGVKASHWRHAGAKVTIGVVDIGASGLRCHIETE